MAALFDKFLGYIGIKDEYEDEDNTEELYEDDEDNVVQMSNRGRAKREQQGSNVVPLSSAVAQQKVIVYRPINYEDTQNIIDNIRSRKPVIVNMEDLEFDCARRILDFIAGATYALDGVIHKISRGIFLVAPTNYDVIGNGESDDTDII